jgi:hypothetical protein
MKVSIVLFFFAAVALAATIDTDVRSARATFENFKVKFGKGYGNLLTIFKSHKIIK